MLCFVILLEIISIQKNFIWFIWSIFSFGLDDHRSIITIFHHSLFSILGTVSGSLMMNACYLCAWVVQWKLWSPLLPFSFFFISVHFFIELIIDNGDGHWFWLFCNNLNEWVNERPSQFLFFPLLIESFFFLVVVRMSYTLCEIQFQQSWSSIFYFILTFVFTNDFLIVDWKKRLRKKCRMLIHTHKEQRTIKKLFRRTIIITYETVF